MEEKSMNWVANKSKSTELHKPLLKGNTLFEAKSYHESFEEYEQTPLVRLKKMAEFMGISEIYLKDESFRFGLNSFKVLGASYAIGKYLAQRLGKDIAETPYSVLKSEEVKKQLGDLTFVACTDGNHGRGVAWTARHLGYNAVIYMPKGSTQNRVNHILQQGAQVTVTDWNYDETVRFVAEQARKNGWEVIQDTAWEGYEDVPTWIMQGYSTMAQEVIVQLQGVRPTHIFLQAGVGAFASVIASFFMTIFEKNPPKIVIVEPDKADCFYKSALAGKSTSVTGDLNTIMAGLACGEPNPVAYEILKYCTDVFVSTPDWMTARGMRILGNPLKDDTRVISGESGAIPMGLLSAITCSDKYNDLKEELGLNENSRVLLFSTEGNTDTEVYRRIVWDGDYQSIL
jgi:diaminopropionate ammonia-lyase